MSRELIIEYYTRIFMVCADANGHVHITPDYQLILYAVEKDKTGQWMMIEVFKTKKAQKALEIAHYHIIIVEDKYLVLLEKDPQVGRGIYVFNMGKSKVGKNGANKKLHTKLRKRKFSKEQAAKELRKAKLKELGKKINMPGETRDEDI